MVSILICKSLSVGKIFKSDGTEIFPATSPVSYLIVTGLPKVCPNLSLRFLSILIV